MIEYEDLMFEWYYNGMDVEGIDEWNMIRIVGEIYSKYKGVICYMYEEEDKL